MNLAFNKLFLYGSDSFNLALSDYFLLLHHEVGRKLFFETSSKEVLKVWMHIFPTLKNRTFWNLAGKFVDETKLRKD